MKRKSLILYRCEEGQVRTVFKNRHGRIIFLKLRENNTSYTIAECFYVDRKSRGKYYATPQKLKTKTFNKIKISYVLKSELDSSFCDIEVSEQYEYIGDIAFIDALLAELNRGYKFLIFIGDGKSINGIPERIGTRLKNRIHRGIYLSFSYCGDGKGKVDECCYYDKAYKSRQNVMPQMLSSVFIRYTGEEILKLVNNELNCDFTNIIFIVDGSIDIHTNKTALCGNV